MYVPPEKDRRVRTVHVSPKYACINTLMTYLFRPLLLPYPHSAPPPCPLAPGLDRLMCPSSPPTLLYAKYTTQGNFPKPPPPLSRQANLFVVFFPYFPMYECVPLALLRM